MLNFFSINCEIPENMDMDIFDFSYMIQLLPWTKVKAIQTDCKMYSSLSILSC